MTLQFTVTGDFNITNQLVAIPVGVSEVCFQLVAVDDVIVESDEMFILVVEATNSNDMVDGNIVVVTISDNDRKDDNVEVHNHMNECLFALYRCEP